MHVATSINNAFVWLVVIVILFGLALGLAANQTDLVNFMRNSAAAEQQHIANQYQAAQNKIDLANYQAERQLQSQENLRLIKAETDAKIAQAQETARLQQQTDANNLQRDAQLTDIGIKTLLGLGIGLSAALSAGVLFLVYCLAQLIELPQGMSSRIATNGSASAVVESEPWHDPAHRAWRITQARTRELKDLEARSARRSTPTKVPSVNRR